MKGWKTRTRIAAVSGAAVIVVMLTLGVLAYTQLRTIEGTATRVTKDTLPSIYLIGKLQSATLLRYTLLTDHVDTDDKAEKAQLDWQIDRAKAEIDDDMNQYEKLIVSPRDRQLFEALKAARTPYAECHIRVLCLSREGKRKQALELIEDQLIPLRNAFLKAADAEVAWNKANADDAAKAIMAAVNWTSTGVLICLGFSVVVAAIARGIQKQLRAERKLREGEELFRGVFENAPFGMCVDGLDGRFIQVNAAFCRMLGYSERELADKTWPELTYVDDLQPSLQINEQLLKNPDGCLEAEKRYIHSSGAVVWTRINVSLVRDGGCPRYFVIHAEDITERKRTQEALRKSEERFREVFEEAPFGMSVTSLDGHFIQVNAALCRMLGYSELELADITWADLTHPDDVEASRRREEQLRTEPSGCLEAEKRYLHRNGTVVWGRMRIALVRDDGANPMYFVIHVEDITERKQAEEALRESEERFRVMADGCPAPMWVTSAEGGIQFINRAFREFTGTTYEQMQGHNWPLALHPEDAQEYVAVFQRAVREHAPFRAETRSRRADGDWRWFDSAAEPRFSADGEYLGHVGLSVDITERKQAEEALRAVEERTRMLAQALESAGECISIADTEDRILYANAAFLRTYGYGEFELIGRHIGMLRSSRTPQETEREILPATLAGHWAGELWNRAKDGREFLISLATSVVYDEGGRKVALVGIARDITERKQAEQALQASEEKFRQLAENIREVFFVLATADQTLYVSPGFERIWGRSCDSVYRNPLAWQEAIHPDDLEHARLLAARRWLGDPVEFEYRIQTPDGLEKWIQSRSFPVRDHAGQLIRIVGLAEEITERKRHEAELIQAREGADTANRAKSCFLANMSHEIRTPMNGVIGMLQLLGETDLTPEQQRYADVAQSSGRTLLALIDNILDLSKIEARKIALEKLSFNLRDTLEDVVQLMRVQANAKGLPIHSRVSPEIPLLLGGDPHRLRQVLTNLCANAIKFTERGAITMDAALAGEGNGTATVRFRVTDTGIGIRRDQAPTLFAPFTQADVSTTRRYGGSGLGLAISKQLAEMMGGAIGVDSREGQGSTFWFTAVFDLAPASQPQPAGHRRDERSGAPVGTMHIARDERILVAEDTATNRYVALAQLRKLGYKANAVANGAEAVEAVERGGFDLVLMDCQMPVMDGFEATRRLRSSAQPGVSGIPIVAVTADAMRDDRHRCLSEGMDDYLSKPVELERLANVLAKWLPASVPGAAAPTPGHPAGTLPTGIFDAEALLCRLMGDRQLAGNIIEGFLEATPSKLNHLRARLDEADGSGARSLAHALKGAAATVGAERLQAILETMEDSAKTAQWDRCREFLPHVIEEFEWFRSTVESGGWIDMDLERTSDDQS
jgi:two-component system sensor histidine kinase/response regulator